MKRAGKKAIQIYSMDNEIEYHPLKSGSTDSISVFFLDGDEGKMRKKET